MVNKFSTALESSLRQQLWESYLTGPTAESLPSDDNDKHESIESTSVSMQNEEFGFEFDQNSFAYYRQDELDPTSGSEDHSANNFDYDRYQFSKPRNPENTGFCRYITQPSVSARELRWSSKEYELVPERSLLPHATPDANYINPTQLMVSPIC